MTGKRTPRRQAPTAHELGLPPDPPEVPPSAGPSAHTRAAVDAQLREMLAHHDGTREGVDPDELHQFRVAIRRIRSLLKNSPYLGEAGSHLRDELKWLAGVTSPVRDLDVLLERLTGEIDALPDADPTAAEALLGALRKERGSRRRTLGQALSSARYRKILAGLAELAEAPRTDDEHDEPAGTKLVASLNRPYRKLDQAATAVDGDASDTALHELRIRVKRLRYAGETALPAARGSDRKQLKSLVRAGKRLQNVLGDHQDAVVAAAKLEQLAADTEDSSVAFLAGRLVEREQQRKNEARDQWPKLHEKIDKAAKKLV